MHLARCPRFCLLSSGWPQPNNKCLLKPIFEFWELSWENIRKKCSDLASTNHYFSKTILKPKLCNNMIEEKSAIYWLTVKIINPENNTTLYIKTKNWHPVIKTLKNLLKKSDEWTDEWRIWVNVWSLNLINNCFWRWCDRRWFVWYLQRVASLIDCQEMSTKMPMTN